MKKTIPVLMYHAIENNPSVISIPVSLFEWQMAWLHAQNAKVIKLETLAQMIAKGQVFPERSIVLTFDDGFLSQYQEAFPILRHYGFAGTVFLVTGYMAKMNDWNGQPAWVPRRPLINWENAREMQSSGIEFGVHTINHVRLGQVSQEIMSEEILGSKFVIEKELDCPVKSFAYPYGDYNHAVREIATKQFLAACTTKIGLITEHSDPWALERIDIYYLKNPNVFKLIFSDAFTIYAKLRRIGHDLSMSWVENNYP